MKYEKIFEIIAKDNNLTVEEVKRYIREALEQSDLAENGEVNIDKCIDILVNRVQEQLIENSNEMIQ